MRRGQKFTAKKLAKWRKEGRGTGTFKLYRAFHQVRRSDPASYGTSSILYTDFDRQEDLLSDAELVGRCCVSRLNGVLDVLEQFPLPLEEDFGVLSRYSAEHQHQKFVGTIELARRMGIAHARASRDKGETAPWVMTSDLVVILRNQGLRVVVVCIKHQKKKIGRRQQKLLDLEKAYWEQQGATWVLFNVADLPRSARHSLLQLTPYVAGTRFPDPVVMDSIADALLPQIPGRLPTLKRQVQELLQCDDHAADRAFWQTVWSGRLPVDLETDFVRDGWFRMVPTARWCDWDKLKGVASWI